MRQIPLDIGHELAATFDDFVVGRNEAAVAHLRQLAAPAAPVYLWGVRGCGKTHLLRALAHERQRRGERVGWFDAAAPLPWPLDADWSLVVIDDCDELDAARQHAAFGIFVEATAEAVQVAAAGRWPPVDLPVREDLRTRLGWGHVFAIAPLDERDMRATLRRNADQLGIRLSDDVLDHLLTRHTRDLKHLMDVLQRLDDYSLARARMVTVPLLRQMLAEEGPTR